MKYDDYKCPVCKSDDIDQFRMPIGPMWCLICGYREDHKELPSNSFLIENQRDWVTSFKESYENIKCSSIFDNIVEEDLLKASDTVDDIKIKGVIEKQETNKTSLKFYDCGSTSTFDGTPPSCEDCNLQHVTKCDWKNGKYCGDKELQMKKWPIHINNGYTSMIDWPPKYPKSCEDCTSEICNCDWENNEFCEVKNYQIRQWNFYINSLVFPIIRELTKPVRLRKTIPRLYDRIVKRFYSLSDTHQVIIYSILVFILIKCLLDLVKMLGGW